MIKQSYIIFLVLLAILNYNSCSYFLREPGRPPKVGEEPVSDNLRKIYVHNFQNHSYGPAIHIMLTQALKSEIDRRGRFIQTREKSEAAYRLYGAVSHYQKTGNLMDAGNQHISSEITAVVKLEIQENGGEKLLLERDEIMARAYYSDQIGYRESEEQAQSRLMNNLAIRISKESENAWYYHVKEKYYKNVEKKSENE
ncbi:MAG: hypothetical protein KDK36_01050 [Leptospiraceae bacterium]|nr:hypothetical protein [Leptospiraceae bacterium]